MVEMNKIYYVSLVVRKIQLFVGTPNFQLNNHIIVSLYVVCFFLTFFIQINFLFNFFSINQRWVCV